MRVAESCSSQIATQAAVLDARARGEPGDPLCQRGRRVRKVDASETVQVRAGRARDAALLVDGEQPLQGLTDQEDDFGPGVRHIPWVSEEGARSPGGLRRAHCIATLTSHAPPSASSLHAFCRWLARHSVNPSDTDRPGPHRTRLEEYGVIGNRYREAVLLYWESGSQRWPLILPSGFRATLALGSSGAGRPSGGFLRCPTLADWVRSSSMGGTGHSGGHGGPHGHGGGGVGRHEEAANRRDAQAPANPARKELTLDDDTKVEGVEVRARNPGGAGVHSGQGEGGVGARAKPLARSVPGPRGTVREPS